GDGGELAAVFWGGFWACLNGRGKLMTSKREKRKEVYDAAAHWRDKCLVEDGSLFGDGSLWKKEYFGKEFAEMFDACHKINALMPRLKCQVKELPSKYHKLAVEMLWAMYLPNSSITPGGKRKNLQIIADVSGAKLPSGHDFLQDAPMHGLGKLGRPFYTNLWFEMMCLILCVREIKHLDLSERKRLLTASDSNDGTELSRLWDGWPEKWRAQWGEDWWEKNAKNRRGKLKKAEQLSIRHSMMHLFFPGHYEPAFSSGQKMQIVSFFNPSMDPEKMSWTEIDGAIRAIRKEQEKTHGTPLDFYDDPLWSLWHKGKKPNGNGGQITQSMLNIPLNQIFYGPPGTGKTYHTVNAALEILDNEFYQANKDDRQSLKNRFDELKQGGQIGVVTFHQSFGYEEFVEGIRPMMAEGEDETVAYEIKSGIFKDLCQRAQSPRPAFEFDEAIEKLKKDCTENPVALRTTVKGSEFTITYRGGKTFRFKTYKTESPKTKSPSDPERDDPVNIEHIKKVYRGANPYEFYNSPYLLPIVNYVKEKYGIGDSAGDGGQGISHVLIIDEINRGNISRIFGELITLIEESKRVGNAEAIEVALPYSGDTFGVPNNLYIIGTMNTADRSIALLDTALRRRFRFVEMMPRPKLLAGIDVDGIKIQNLLAAMNEHIEALYDRDHQIGHSFFLRLENNSSIETLADIFEHEILPLLQEYFYDDWEKIDLVLNRNKFLEQNDPPKMPDGAVADDRKIWSIKKSELLVPANYQKIYADAADDNAA
ncbi:MAG: AAA family ATPase, partial [Alphaproteobacteria bacterium]|nr:AAA family ATPase [Alphaproteobacteria bacterium]